MTIPVVTIAYVLGVGIGTYLGVAWERWRWMDDDESPG